jgi:hypothetical protein
LKDKIEDDEIVKENFENIFAKSKKNANKEAIEELEKKFYAGEKPDAKPRAKKEGGAKKRGVKRNYNKLKSEDSESVSVVSSSDVNNIQESSRAVSKRRAGRNNKMIIDDEDEEDYE